MTIKYGQLDAPTIRALEQNDKLAKAAHRTLADASKAIAQSSALQQFFMENEQRKALFRAAEGSLAGLQPAGIFGPDYVVQHELAGVKNAMAALDARFSLPAVGEAARFAAEIESRLVPEGLLQFFEQTTSIRQAMEAMQTPWLDASDAMRSVSGFAELQGIGHALANMPTFDEDLASALRVELGDWRDQITWPEGIFNNLVERSEFYTGLGFDRALTDFPAPAFQQSVEIAGLRTEPPSLVACYGAPVPPSEDGEEEEGFARTNMAHGWLLRLETQLRRFIDEQMTQAFGPDWPRHRLPNDLYDKWQEKKRNAERAGEREWPLIAYADFTDYEPVISKRDNWREVFAVHFVRPESVRESFQRLRPIRLDTMHARPITQDDELLLYVETKRMMKIIIY